MQRTFRAFFSLLEGGKSGILCRKQSNPQTGEIKTMKCARLTLIIVAGLACLSASAQDKPAAKKKTTGSAGASGMPMPKPAPEMKDLRDMIGTWTTEETFEPSPWMPSGGPGTGTNTVRLGPGGFTVVMDQRSKSSTGSFTGHGLLTWDPNEKVYRFAWADSMSPGVMIETGRKDGDNLVFTGEATMMGKKVSVRDEISDRTPT